MKFKDLTGQVFGRLTVVGFDYKTEKGTYHWLCQCRCGNTTSVNRTSLVAGRTQSCGCFGRENSKVRATKHGMSKTKTYNVWVEMRNRATNKNHKNAKYYSDKGITVCERWDHFSNFLEDMGEQPEGLWLERIDNSLGYFKDNCKWETPSRQCSNRSREGSLRLGVSYDSSADKFRALIVVDKNVIDKGRFSNFEAACKAIEEAEIEHLGYSRKEF